MVVFRFTGSRTAQRRTRRPWTGTPIVLEQLEDRCLPSAGPALPPPSATMLSPTYEILHHSPGLSANSGPGSGYGYSPSQLQAAYGFNLISFPSGGKSVAGDGTGQTIAIVDAYDDPNITSDLAAFDSATTGFGLPAPPSFTKIGINAAGQASTTSFPSPDPNWSIEISLDVEWSHAIAPAANIVLVEANSASLQDLANAVQYAASYSGVSVVSMSWGGPEGPDTAPYDNIFTTPSGHTGVTFVASSGDSGAGIEWPCVDPLVVAAGGTTLNADSSGNYQSESAWSGSGGGISITFPAPSYQKNLKVFSGDPQPNGMRAVPDVAYDADPSTGVPVYATFGSNGWLEVGGTSAAAPQWASLFAIADQGRVLHGVGTLDGFTQTLPDLYQAPASDYHDITTGSNGFPAGPGYDLVTGLGSPRADQLMPDLGAPMVQQVLTSVSINPSNPTIGDGGQEQFAAIGNDQFNHPMVPQPSFTWQLLSGQGSLSSTGVYSAPATGTGSATVQVTATEGGVTVTNTTNVTYQPGPAISNLAAKPNPTSGTTTTLSATLSDTNPGILNYTWSVVTMPAGASTPTLAPSAGTTAPGNISSTATFDAAGGYLFQLSVTDTLNITTTATVSVTVDQTLTTIQVIPGSANVANGGQQQFTAQANDQFGQEMVPQPSFTWSMQTGSQGTIDQTGLYTAPSTGSGTDTVVASAPVGNTPISGTGTVTYGAGLAITSLIANPNPVIGNTTTVTAQISDTNPIANGINYTWTAADANGDPVLIMPFPLGVTQPGTLIATLMFQAQGTYNVTLFLNDGLQTATDTVTVTVSSQTLQITSLTASPNPAPGNTTTLTAQIFDPPSMFVAYQWSVVSPAGAQVQFAPQQQGTTSVGTLTTTATFGAPGTYVIELDVTDHNNSATDQVTVVVNGQSQGPSITSLSANPSPVVGATGTLVAQVADPNYQSVTYTWSVVSTPLGAPTPGLSPTTGTANVGTNFSTTTTYYAPGNYTFELDVSDASGASVSQPITVTVDAAAPSINLSATPTTVTGTTTALSGAVTDANEVSPNYQYTWSVVQQPAGVQAPTFAPSSSGTAASNPITATATFYAAGAYQLQLSITDTWGAIASNTVTVTVAQTLTTVTVAPAKATLTQGATQQFTAQAYDQFKTLMSPQPSFNWLISSGPGSVSSTGLYTAPTTTTGTAVVEAIATVNGVTVNGSATVTITAQAPVITFIGANPNPVTGTTSTLTVKATDPAGGNLSYAWSVQSKPSGAASPSFNASTSAVTGVTFYQAGSYTFKVTVTSSVTGASTSKTVTVTVAQTLTKVTVSPALTTLHHGQTRQLTAYAYDQFNKAITATFSWSMVSGPGSVSSTGLYTAPLLGTGKAVVKAAATVGGVTTSGTGTILVS